MGGSKPKKSGAPPTRWSTRHGKQRIVLAPYLYQGARARIDRSNTTGDGVQAGVQAAVAAASVEDTEQVCAAGWHNGHKGRAEARIISAVRTMRSRPASAGGATAAEMQKIQDLSVVVVGLLSNDKLLKQLIKAMCVRNGKLTQDLQKLQAEVDAMK